jgi:DNA polymerase III delta subunit
MLFILHGPDDYRRTARQRVLIDQFTGKYGAMGLQRFDATDEDDLRGFRGALNVASLFSPRRMLTLANALEAPNALLKEVIARAAESKTFHVLLNDPGKTITKAQAFLAKPPVTVEAFPYLEGAAWKKFVDKTAEQEGIVLPKELAARLADTYEADTWGLVTEVQTLALYVKPANDLHTAAPLELTGNFWEQMGALRNPVRAKRLAQLERMLAIGEPEPKLFAMLSYQSKTMLPEAAALDRKIKIGKLDYDDALLALVIA